MSSRVALHEKQLTASVWLISDEPIPRILLLHHKKLGVWMQPGGHVERSENPREGAIREVQEETGMDISTILKAGKKVDQSAFLLPQPQFFMEQKIPAHGEQPEHFHLDVEYVVQVPFQEPQVQEAESNGIGWFTLEEAMQLETFENTHQVIQEIFAKKLWQAPSP